MKTVLSVKNLLYLLIFIPTVVFGQSTLRGIVVDSTAHETIAGANVVLIGTPLGCATNVEGAFFITGIPQKSQQVKISCIGFEPKVVTIDFTRQTTVNRNFELKPAIIMGVEVVVTAQLRGQVAAINQQLTSNTIVNVVSEERIKELPDANAAEAIGRLPGVSILRSGGEANRVTLRGLSDRFSAITIDGVRMPGTDTSSRGVDLSLLSQGSLAGIELFKALTPDKDGDAIAGSINLVTKKAPSEREIIVDAKGGYNHLMKSAKQYDFQLRYGERFFDDILGVQVRGNLEQRIRSNERTNTNYTQLPDDYFISDFIVEFTDETRTRNGGTLLVDVNTPDNGSIRASVMYAGTKRDYLYSTRNYPYGTGILLTYAYRDREQEITTFNSSVRGENHLFGMDITWGGSFAQSKTDLPFDYSIDFQETSEKKDTVLISGMRPPPQLRSNPELIIPYAINNFALSYAQNAYFRTEKNLEKEKTAYLDLLTKYIFGNIISGELKFGGKYKYRNRDKISGQSYSPYYLGYWQESEMTDDGTIQPKNFTGTPFQNYYDRYILSNRNARIPVLADFLSSTPEARDLMGKYRINPLIDKDAMKSWYNLNKNGISASGTTREFYNDPTADLDYYDIIERVSAGYIMNTLNFGQELTLITGVRVEKELNDYKSRYTPTGIGGFPVPFGIVMDTSVSFTETIWLPNVQVTARPFEFLNIRLAAYKAIARPDYNLRLLKYLQSGNAVGGGSANSLLLGNKNLRTAKAWNFEANASIYSNTIGLITVSGFYKEITDFFHVLQGAPAVGKSIMDTLGVPFHYGAVDTLGTGGWQFPFSTGQQYSVTIPYNSPKPTKVWGFEFEHQANFNFLPGLFKNFVFSYNVSLLRSETYLMSSGLDTTWIVIRGVRFPQYTSTIIETKQKLEGQPELYGNAALGYDIGGFSARVSVFFQGKFNNTFSATQLSDRINDGLTRWDLALKQQVTDNIAVMLNVNNLTNMYETTTTANRIQGWNLSDTGQFYGLTADLGVRITL